MNAKAYELLFPSCILIFAFIAIAAYIHSGAGPLFYASAIIVIAAAIYFTKAAPKSQETPKSRKASRKRGQGK